jgi:predicted AAA+ superfamily ATPase
VKNSIISTAVEKDILQFSRVKNPELFRQAFELLISYPAQEISYSKLLGQLQDRGNVELTKHYISLYKGAYLIKT